MRPLLVAITGGSGSGKTLLATQLLKALSGKAALLSLDDFYRDRSHLSPARRMQINFDHPRAIDWPVFEQVLGACIAGKPVRIPCYDFANHCRLPTAAWFKPRPVVLVEGLWVMRSAALRRLYGLRVFIQCPPAIRLKRRLARDQSAARARTAASIRRQFRGTVEPMHNRHVSPQGRWADVVLRETWGKDEIKTLVSRVNALSQSGKPGLSH